MFLKKDTMFLKNILRFSKKKGKEQEKPQFSSIIASYSFLFLNSSIQKHTNPKALWFLKTATREAISCPFLHYSNMFFY